MPIVGKGKKDTIRTEMHKFKEGTLHSGSKHGPEVKNRSQAIAIALSEGRKAGKGHSKSHREEGHSKKKHNMNHSGHAEHSHGGFKYHE